MNGTRTALWELECRWTMGRVVPRDLLSTVGIDLRREAPRRRAYVLAVIRRRAEEIRDEHAELPVDEPSEAMLALSATVLATRETLLDVFTCGDDRTVAYLAHALGTVRRRPRGIGSMGLREDPLGAIETACRAEAPHYGEYVAIRYDRPGPDTFEMRVERCFFHDLFARRGVPGLTAAVCTWDAPWRRTADGPPEAGGPSVTPLDDDACGFRVVRR
ncbi:hypothetical protein [Actinomycetospora flava]|uniref:L-2-amino-thiazoline-4-carboxylic acid hydrolase n=1 Tax=Actinomycetospora flava TaxID=3129232 RepID=A0ABU8LZK6_9PSEU